MNFSDSRMKLTNEILNGIKVISPKNHTHTCTHTNIDTQTKHTNTLTSIHTHKRTCKQTHKQTLKQINKNK